MQGSLPDFLIPNQEIEVSKDSIFCAKVVLQPMERGFGITLGNAPVSYTHLDVYKRQDRIIKRTCHITVVVSDKK